MPRPKTPYVIPPPPSRLKPDSILRKYLTQPFSGKNGTLRLLGLIVGTNFVFAAAVLADVYLFRREKYPPFLNTEEWNILKPGELPWREKCAQYWEETKDFFSDKPIDNRINRAPYVNKADDK